MGMIEVLRKASSRELYECRNCGKNLAEGVDECPNCGWREIAHYEF
ncbi:hypothetical protein [Natronococcus wangiae]|nr:hypothetical protein [Natronococcus sp. AD5]